MRPDDPTAVISAIGSCLPDRVLDNDEIITAGSLRTTDEWVRSRTGIAHRHRARPGGSTGDLAVAAGRAALEAAQGPPPDLLLLATSTPDHPCPATAPETAHRLGLGTIPAFDLSAVCSGFLYALTTATALLRDGTCGGVLLIAAETYSTIVNPNDRDTAALFGDGAAAVLLRPGPASAPGAVLATDWGSDGSGRDLITIPVGGSRHPGRSRRQPQPPPDAAYFQMRGREVYAHAVRRMTQSARAVLRSADWPADTVRAFIGHQANQRILDAVGERLGIDPAHRLGNLREVGNTAAASIPLALADATRRGTVAPGERTLLTAFGGGLTWASAAVNWPAAIARSAPEPAPQPAAEPQPEAVRTADPTRSPAWTPSTSTS